MASDIKESDWKLFRQLHPVALERYCERVLTEVQAAMIEKSEGAHGRYLKLYDLVRERDKMIGRLFNDPRRSNALILLVNIKQEGLLTAEEFARFSPETRERIENIEAVRAHNKS
jgi:hypothetical protein